jgi:acetyltransferase (GNAT) family protein
MRARLLPVEEWHRLEGLGPQINGLVGPDNAEVFVVEDGEKIVGCFTVARVTYLESVTILPEYRGNLGVVRALTRQAFDAARKHGRWAMGGAADGDPDMMSYLIRLGAEPLPAMFFAVPLERSH